MASPCPASVSVPKNNKVASSTQNTKAKSLSSASKSSATSAIKKSCKAASLSPVPKYNNAASTAKKAHKAASPSSSSKCNATSTGAKKFHKAASPSPASAPKHENAASASAPVVATKKLRVIYDEMSTSEASHSCIIDWRKETVVQSSSEPVKKDRLLKDSNTSYHNFEEHLQKAAVGPRKMYSQAKELRYGQILQGIGNNEFLVSCSDAIQCDLHSYQLTLVDNEEILPNKKILVELLCLEEQSDYSVKMPTPQSQVYTEDMASLYQTVKIPPKEMIDIPPESIQ